MADSDNRCRFGITGICLSLPADESLAEDDAAGFKRMADRVWFISQYHGY